MGRNDDNLEEGMNNIPPFSGSSEDDPYHNHYEKLQNEYKEAQENFDPIFYLIGLILFLVMIQIAKKFGLTVNFEEDEVKEKDKKMQIPKNLYVIINDHKFDVSKEIELGKENSEFFKDDGKFKNCFGKDITVSCSKENFTSEFLNKELGNLTPQEVTNLSKYYTEF